MDDQGIGFEDIYGTDQNRLVGPLVAKHFEPGLFIDYDQVKKEAKEYNRQLQKYINISKDYNLIENDTELPDPDSTTLRAIPQAEG